MNKNADVFVKDEGYADFRFISNKAKQTAHDLGFPNSLDSFGDTFCGEPIWNNKTKKGMYKCGVEVRYVKRYVKDLEKEGLTVECEF